jgi:hypothetical protein
MKVGSQIYTIPDFIEPKSATIGGIDTGISFSLADVSIPASAKVSQIITCSSGPTFTSEINFEPYLKVKVTKEEILIALREYYPEKFI